MSQYLIPFSLWLCDWPSSVALCGLATICLFFLFIDWIWVWTILFLKCRLKFKWPEQGRIPRVSWIHRVGLATTRNVRLDWVLLEQPSGPFHLLLPWSWQPPLAKIAPPLLAYLWLYLLLMIHDHLFVALFYTYANYIFELYSI